MIGWLLLILGSLFVYFLCGFGYAAAYSEENDYCLNGVNEHLGFALIWPLFAVVHLSMGVLWLVKNIRPGVRNALDHLIKGVPR